jgi:hypothetical protein
MSVLFGQEWQCLGEGSCPSNLVPTLKAFGTESSVSGSGKQLTAGSKMRGDDAVYFDKALGMPGGLKASHAPLALPCRLMLSPLPGCSLFNVRRKVPRMRLIL